MKEIAHELKGSSASIGAERLAMVCDRLEDTVHKNSYEEGNELIRLVEEEYDLLKPEIEIELQTERISL